MSDDIITCPDCHGSGVMYSSSGRAGMPDELRTCWICRGQRRIHRPAQDHVAIVNGRWAHLREPVGEDAA